MDAVAISFGSIILMAIIFYFVIKAAVKNGINESFLFSQKQRKDCEYKEMKEVYQSIGYEDVPDDIKKYFGKDV